MTQKSIDFHGLLERLLPLEELPPVEPQRVHRALAAGMAAELEDAAFQALAQLERRGAVRRLPATPSDPGPARHRPAGDAFDVITVPLHAPTARAGVLAVPRATLPRHANTSFAHVGRLLRLDDAATTADPRTGRGRSGLIAQLDQAGRELLGAMSVRFHPVDEDAPAEPPLDPALAAECLRRPGSLLYCGDTASVPRLAAETARRGVRALALAAVVPGEGPPLGHLEVHADRAHPYRAEELAMVALLADSCAAALERAARIEKLVFVDPLTTVYNRSYFDLQVENEMARAFREHNSLALALVDIDDFKSFNTRYGYEAGNAVLVQTAAALRRAVRPFDTVARWGGEEFAVLLTSPVLADDVLTICERLRSIVERTPVRLEGLDRTQHQCAVTVSIGVAMSPDHADSAHELFRAANRALLEAKRPPKNRVVFFHREPAGEL